MLYWTRIDVVVPPHRVHVLRKEKNTSDCEIRARALFAADETDAVRRANLPSIVLLRWRVCLRLRVLLMMFLVVAKTKVDVNGPATDYYDTDSNTRRDVA